MNNMEVCYEKTYSKKISLNGSLNNICHREKIQDVAIQKVLERNPNVKMKIQVKVVKIIAGVYYYHSSEIRVFCFSSWNVSMLQNHQYFWNMKMEWYDNKNIPHDFSYSENSMANFEAFPAY